MALRLAEDLALPIEAATQTFLIVGKRGSGKSSTAKRLVEQMIRAHVPVVIVDPVDRWWGLKADRAGTGPGLRVHIFGGAHADLPLEPTAGALIADVLVEHRISAILAIRQWSDADRTRFLTDFAARLFQKNTEPLHLVLEEAHEAAPQQPFKGEERMLHHVTRIWKLGRSSGLGGAAVTQRPASLSKNITTQAEILVIHRTLGPQDVAAVREWIRYHGEREDVLGELATLQTGEAFVWSPDFPEGKPVGLRRVRVLECETFDSFATPKVGEERREPKELAPVDLDRLRTKMAQTIERAKAEDPRELRRRIAELEGELRNKSLHGAQPKVAPSATPKRVEVPILKDVQVKVIEAAVARVEKAEESVAAALERRAEVTRALAIALEGVTGAIRAKLVPADQGAVDFSLGRPVARGVVHFTRPPANRVQPSQRGGPGQKMAGGERRILTALAQYPQGRTKAQVAILAQYAVDGGGYQNLLGALRSKGWIEGSDDLRLTEAGAAALGTYEPLPQGRDLVAHWLGKLGKAERVILQVVVDAYPRALPKEVIAEKTGYEATGGGFQNALGRLRTLELVVGRAEIRAAEGFFE